MEFNQGFLLDTLNFKLGQLKGILLSNCILQLGNIVVVSRFIVKSCYNSKCQITVELVEVKISVFFPVNLINWDLRS